MYADCGHGSSPISSSETESYLGTISPLTVIRLSVQLQCVCGPGRGRAAAEVQGGSPLGQAGGGQDGEGSRQESAVGQVPGRKIQLGPGPAGP
jgi:hypothetical protein